MKLKNILVTGGAGFIGSHIVDRLIEKGYQVTILDNLDKQVHNGKIPKYLNKKVRFIKGDVTKYSDLKAAIGGMDTIYHQAAVVGVGQSMYEIDRYVYNNILGTARILDYLANNKHKVKRIMIASSMSVYGEGLYACSKCGPVRPALRETAQMEKEDWELHCPKCNSYLAPVGIPESEKFACNSIYAVTKQAQEDMVMIFGNAYKIPATAFRYFNVYGPRQSLSNPYTGVATIFLSRLKNDNPPVVYEDGLQTRDFIFVHDIADVNVLALENPKAFGKVFNLGTGNPKTIKDTSTTLAKLLRKNIEPSITNSFRPGDVRHCYADISLIQSTLSWSPKWTFEREMEELIRWGVQTEAVDLFESASV